MLASDEAEAAGTSLVILERFQGGDDRAAAMLFDRYFERLTALARYRLSAKLASRIDPEDIVMSTYRCFFASAREGRFELRRGGDLWRLLASITARKLLRQVRHHRQARRSVDREIPIDRVNEESLRTDLQGPTPEEAAALADELELLIARLDDFGRTVLERRLQGARLQEIADETNRSERSVRRSIAEIRTLLAGQFDDAEG